MDESTKALQRILKKHRLNIADWLDQQASDPSDTRYNRRIEDARKNIKLIKHTLRQKGIKVEDEFWDGSEAVLDNEANQIDKQKTTKGYGQGSKGAKQGDDESYMELDPILSPSPVKNCWAIVVGVSQHEHLDYYGKLPHAANDAYQVADVLLSGAYGYSRERLRLFVDEEDVESKYSLLVPDSIPNWDSILGAVDDFLYWAEEDDLLFFYFSGHGQMNHRRDEAYLVCRNTNPYSRSLLERTAIPMSYIKEGLEDSKAKVRTIILDTCHSGMLLSKRKTVEPMDEAFMQQAFKFATGTVMMTSCGAEQYSFPFTDSNLSAFTYYLIQGFYQMGLQKRSFVTDGMLKSFVAEQLKKWAYISGYPQTPQFKNFSNGDIIVADFSDLQRNFSDG